ncbi:MAG: DUF5659 domain-containing protein [Patescibacteria group bacterium]
METRKFGTKDLGEATALYSQGLPITGMSWVGSECHFIFNKNKLCLEIIKKYWEEKLQVDAYKYFISLKNLKSRMFSRKS